METKPPATIDPMTLDHAITATGERMLPYFQYQHLPDRLARTSKWFADLAVQITVEVPQSPERTVALRKLLESKDCAVRALL